MSTLYKTPSGKELFLPSTADDFELYTSVEGCEIAAKELFQALVALADEIDPFAAAGYAPTPATVSKLYQKHVAPILDKHGKYGSSDSEPRVACRTSIRNDIVRGLTGETLGRF